MFSTSDTIVAIATPPGRGGIGVVRLSGSGAHAITARLITHHAALEPRHATLTTIRLPGSGDRGAERSGPAASDTVLTFPTGTSSGNAGLSDPAAADTVLTFPTSTRRAALSGPRPPSVAAGAIDQVVATFFPSPASYTGDDVVELSAHGSPVVLHAIVAAAIEHGARLAERGEFTLRAFLNGRMDLMQAEAVADLIDAATPLQARAAFDQLDGTLTRRIAVLDASLFDLIARLEASVDFPDEGYHFVDPTVLATAIDTLLRDTAALAASGRSGRLIREGLQVAIVGAPNVGKSSVFNALVGASRAIVTNTPGTTRDLVTEVVDIHGLRVTLVDTAGMRETQDLVEAEGVERARQAATVADVTLEVYDGSADGLPPPINSTQTAENKRLIVKNMSDICPESVPGTVLISAKTGDGIDTLREAIVQALDVDLPRDSAALTNIRHIGLVERAHAALARARAAALAEGGAMSEEFVLADLQDARAALEEVTGRRTPEDVLEHIFSRFCVGK